MQVMRLIRGSVGRKLLVAVTGLLLVGFVIAHLLGNLTIYYGEEGINAYAVHLRSLGPLLWLFRAGLLAVFAVHVWLGIWLTLENRAAKPTAYAKRQPRRTTFAGRTMIWSGLALAAFIVYHLLHFTFRFTHPEISHFVDPAGRADVLRMVVLSFRQLTVTIIYLVGMAALWLHLKHGIGSTFQTLGANDDRSLPVLSGVGLATALILALGFSAIPVLIYIGIVTI
ncbi:MAG: succinate dehydrogenase cytochrome b subunit [Syntrophotaleaceae bacterium]